MSLTISGISKPELEEIIARHLDTTHPAIPECAAEIFRRLSTSVQQANGHTYDDALRDKFEYEADTIKKTVLAGVEPYPLPAMLADFKKRGAAGWEVVTVSQALIPPNTFMCQTIWKRKIMGTRQ